VGTSVQAKTVLVLGAGINGAAVARELVLSGVSVIVVDSDDVACGATAWSTRLVHGGLRYLEYGEVGLVRESLAERERLVRLAGHLVEPLPFYIPLERRSGGMLAAGARLAGWTGLARRLAAGGTRGSWTVGVGLALYDLLASGSRWPRHRMVRAGGAGLPAVDSRRFPLAATYTDAQMLYPERFTVELLLDAAAAAAQRGVEFAVLPHHAVRSDSRGGFLLEPRTAAGEAREIRPDAVVNASGAWVDQTRLSVPLAAGGHRRIGGTKGSHLVLDAARLRPLLCDYGVYAEASDGRPIFVLPFGRRLVLVGTTDLPFEGDPRDARTDDAEIDYLLKAAATIFPAAPPTRSEVMQHYCGVRPLPYVPPGTPPGAITRRHLFLREPQAPLPTWSIVGGKLTTCRSLAEESAAELLGCLGLPVIATSADRPLPGAPGPGGGELDRLAARLRDGGLDRDGADAALSRYGLLAEGFLAERTGGGGSGGNGRAIATIGRTGLPLAAVARGIEQEWAATLEDVIERRLMLVFDPALDINALREVAREMARLGRLEEDAVESETARVAADLANRYGRRLADTPAAAVAAGGGGDG
jgi:glycerol-3-phosphate dehydrogenase